MRGSVSKRESIALATEWLTKCPSKARFQRWSTDQHFPPLGCLLSSQCKDEPQITLTTQEVDRRPYCRCDHSSVITLMESWQGHVSASCHPRTQNSKRVTRKPHSLQYLSEMTVKVLSPRQGAQGMVETQCSQFSLLLWEGFKGAGDPESHCNWLGLTFSHF